MATVKSAKRDRRKHSVTTKHQADGHRGGAGKGNWGRWQDDLESPLAIDKNDPNYDSEDPEQGDTQIDYTTVVVDTTPLDNGSSTGSLSPLLSSPSASAGFCAFEACIDELERFKRNVIESGLEYLINKGTPGSGALSECHACLAELNLPLFHAQISKQLIRLSLDKTGKDRKEIFELISGLKDFGFITTRDVFLGIVELVDQLNDLQVDVPDAEDLVQQFAKRLAASGALEEQHLDAIQADLALLDDRDRMVELEARASSAITEYFETEDCDALALDIGDLNAPAFHRHFVRIAISMALDRHAREREATSYMLGKLTGSAHEVEIGEEVLLYSAVERGFHQTLCDAEELRVDVPDAKPAIAFFIARAVADEALAPAWMNHVNLKKTDLGFKTVVKARALLKEPHARSRLEKIWGPGDGRSVAELKQAVTQLVLEFFDSDDLSEALRRAKELDVPHFHHEVVKQVFAVSMDRNDHDVGMAHRLLTAALHNTLISKDQMARGFQRIASLLDEYKIDAPKAPKVFQRLQQGLWQPATTVA